MPVWGYNSMRCKYACETKGACVLVWLLLVKFLWRLEVPKRIFLETGVVEESRHPHPLTWCSPFLGGGALSERETSQKHLPWEKAAVSLHSQPWDVGLGLAGSPAHKNVLLFPRAWVWQLGGLCQCYSLLLCAGNALCSGGVCTYRCDANLAHL